jgi:hypothetical protein
MPYACCVEIPKDTLLMAASEITDFICVYYNNNMFVWSWSWFDFNCSDLQLINFTNTEFYTPGLVNIFCSHMHFANKVCIF